MRSRRCDLVNWQGNDLVKLYGGIARLGTTLPVREGINEIIHTLSQPYSLEGQLVVIGASVGIALSPDDGLTNPLWRWMGSVAQDKKGDVVVVDNGGRLDTATWGEFHGYACKQNGVAGAVIDGATRDGPEIRSSGFPTFVRGMTPVTSKWDLKTASINEPVMLGPIQVNPGDIVFADETGIVVIPAATKELVLRKANEIRKSEDNRRADVS
jgi:regulator of RNase E activity RraA